MIGYYNKDKAIITTQDNLSTPDTKLSYNNLNLINKQVAAQTNNELETFSMSIGNDILPYCENKDTYTPLSKDQIQILDCKTQQESDTAEYNLFNFSSTNDIVYGDKWVYNTHTKNWYSPIIKIQWSPESLTANYRASAIEFYIPALETQNISINTFQDECYSNINTTYNIFLQNKISWFLQKDLLVSFYYYQNHCILIFQPTTLHHEISFRICIHSTSYTTEENALSNIKAYVFPITNGSANLYYHYILNNEGIITDIQSLNLNSGYLYTEPNRNFTIKQAFELPINPFPDIPLRPTRPTIPTIPEIKPSTSN